MADLLAAGKAVLDSFIASLPEELRGSAADTFGKPEAQKAVEKIGEAAMMRSDYSRQLDLVAQEKARAEAERTAAAEHKARLDKWYADAEPLLALGKRAKEEGWSPEAPLQTPKPVELPADLVRKEDLDARERTAVDYIEASADLRFKHWENFHEVLNVRELIADPEVRSLGIQGVYEKRYANRLEEKAKSTREAEWARREAEIRADERKKYASRPLSPVGDDSPLTALETQDKKPGVLTVDDFAAEYERLVSSKTG